MLYGLVPPFDHTDCAAMAANSISENVYDFFSRYRTAFDTGQRSDFQLRK
jgi:hypothetical protein